VETTAESVHKGVRERAAIILGSAGAIPLALWTPESGDPAGIVLVGHGGSGHKREDYVIALARRLVRTHGFAVAAIDGPLHGDRREGGAGIPTLVLLEFAQAWAADAGLTDRMVGDWTATLDELLATPGWADLPVGYWGISMGTLLGLPYVASDDRVDACVLGLAGATGPTAARLALDAPRIIVPTLFLMQLDDELFSTDTSIALFRAIGTQDKRLLAAPGRHRDVTAEAFQLSIDFLGARLGGAAAQRAEAG
jgi:alpha-beta hydrolase superfamily lysophospholipase